MSRERPVVHVTLDGLFAPGRSRAIEHAIRVNEQLDRVLTRHAAGWSRPSADEAVLSAPASPWGPGVTALDWAEALRDDVREAVGLDISVGVAANRVAARVCSRLARPRGVLVWLRGYEGGLVSPVPLEEMDELQPEQVARLRASGVRTIGELAGLASDQAREALGSQAPRLLGMVRGLDAAEHAPDGGRTGRALAVLARRLHRRLSRASRKARGLELRLRYEDGYEHSRYTLLPRATSELEALHSAAERLLSMTSRREHPVAGMKLTATGLAATSGQLALFPLFPFDGAGGRELVVRLGRTS